MPRPDWSRLRSRTVTKLPRPPTAAPNSKVLCENCQLRACETDTGSANFVPRRAGSLRLVPLSKGRLTADTVRADRPVTAFSQPAVRARRRRRRFGWSPRSNAACAAIGAAPASRMLLPAGSGQRKQKRTRLHACNAVCTKLSNYSLLFAHLGNPSLGLISAWCPRCEPILPLCRLELSVAVRN